MDDDDDTDGDIAAVFEIDNDDSLATELEANDELDEMAAVPRELVIDTKVSLTTPVVSIAIDLEVKLG